MCVCSYVRTYVNTYVHKYVCVRMHTYVRMYMYIYICVCVCIYIYVYVSVYMHMYFYVRTVYPPSQKTSGAAFARSRAAGSAAVITTAFPPPDVGIGFRV